jgi:hypothetical protein
MLQEGYITLPIQTDEQKKGFSDDYETYVTTPNSADRPPSAKRRRRLMLTAGALILLGGLFLIPLASTDSSAVPDALQDAWSYGQQRISTFWSGGDGDDDDLLLDLDAGDSYSEPLLEDLSPLNASYGLQDTAALDLFSSDDDETAVEDLTDDSLEDSADATQESVAGDESSGGQAFDSAEDEEQGAEHTSDASAASDEEMASDEAAADDGADTPEEEAEEELEIMLPAGRLSMPKLAEDRPRMTAAEVDAKYCPNSTCKFLLPIKMFEQESKAQQHLYAAGLLAHAQDRILVLPHVRGSRMGACYGNPFSFYYEVNALEQLGFRTILQDGPFEVLLHESLTYSADLFAWINARDRTPTGQILDLSQIISDDPQGSLEIAHDAKDGSAFPHRNGRFCIQQPYSYLDMSKWSPITFFVRLRVPGRA